MSLPKKIDGVTLAQRLEMLKKVFLEQTRVLFGEDDVDVLDIFNKEEWAAEQEPVGKNADLTIDIGETGWWRVVNGFESPEAEDRLNNWLDRTTAKLGLDWDMGHEETLHFWDQKPKR